MMRVTFVMCTRADARGAVECFVDDLRDNASLLAENSVQASFIVVEWGGPVGGRTPIHGNLGVVAARVVYVPQSIVDIHERDGVFAEYTAKNVGVRAALFLDADLIICTNLDIKFSPALAKELSIPHAPDGHIWRAPRWDLDEKGSSLITKHGVGEYWTEAAGDFTGMTPSDWLKLRGYYEEPGWRIHLDGELVTRARLSGFKLVVLAPVMHRKHGNMVSGTQRGDNKHGVNDVLALPWNNVTKPPLSSWGNLGVFEERVYGWEVVP